MYELTGVAMRFLFSLFSMVALRTEIAVCSAQINGSINWQNKKLNVRLNAGYKPVCKRFASALV